MATLRNAVLVLMLLSSASVLAGCLSDAPSTTDGLVDRPDRSVFETQVPGAGEHEVPLTVYRPAGTGPFPALLWGHGWAQNRSLALEDGRFFSENGYVVAAMDFRGHGDANESLARLHSPEHEIADVRAVIDWLAEQPWVTQQAEGDPLLGALGGSYGGGYQLLTAAFDDRVDAIAPEITWNDLSRSLAPNGAIKSAWVDALYGGAKATGVNLHPTIDEAFREAMATNRIPDGSGPSGVDLSSWLERSSPASYPDAIEVPTLLIQGGPDTLFNVNEALANRAQILDDAPVTLFTHRGGHTLHTGGTLGQAGTPDELAIGLQPPPGPSPCGDIQATILAFYDDHLRGLGPHGIPALNLALEDGTCVTSDTAARLLSDEPTVHELGGPFVVPQGAPVPSSTLEIGPGPSGTPSPLRVEVLTAREERVLAGAPVLNGTASLAASDAIVYASLFVENGTGQGHVVDAQVVPWRGEGPAQEMAFELEMGAVATRLAQDDTLYIQLSSWDPQYAHNAARSPGGVVLEDVSLSLPVHPS